MEPAVWVAVSVAVSVAASIATVMRVSFCGAPLQLLQGGCLR